MHMDIIRNIATRDFWAPGLGLNTPGLGLNT